MTDFETSYGDFWRFCRLNWRLIFGSLVWCIMEKLVVIQIAAVEIIITKVKIIRRSVSVIQSPLMTEMATGLAFEPLHLL